MNCVEIQKESQEKVAERIRKHSEEKSKIENDAPPPPSNDNE